MATLPRAPLSSPHFHGAANRVPLFSIEAFSFSKLKRQGLPITYPKQKPSIEKATSWKLSAMAASPTQARLESDQVSLEEETEHQTEEDITFSHWYPVAFVDNLDKRKPTAVTIMGRDLVVWWDRDGQSWQVWKDKCPHRLAPLSEGRINEKGELQCSYHGWCFAPRSGSCTLPPRAPLDVAPVSILSSNTSFSCLGTQTHVVCNHQRACASVYPSVEQGGLIWFWPDTRPEFKGIAARKPPPNVFALADPAFKDELNSGNLPYSYKELIEKLSDPARVHNGLQSAQIQDIESKAALGIEAVQLRSEGDAVNLAEPVDNLHEELSNVLQEKHMNGRSSEVRNISSEDQDTNNYAVAGAGLVPYRDHWPTSLSALSGGSQLVAELTTAWDGLAGRLSPSITSGKHMQQILLALKLTFAALNRDPEDGRLMLVNSLSIAYTLADLQMDATVVAAGLLRSAVEAGLVGISQVDQQVGSDVGRLLHDCMRFKRTLDQMDLFDEESAKAVRQFCLSYHDIRAITIELSSRLQQMRHAHDLPRYQQQILALEALQIHAPLAHAIGTKGVSTELEDLAFKVVLPDSYKFLDNWLLSHWPDENSVLEECKQTLSSALEHDEKLKSLTDSFTISGRLKSRFSIMKKLLKDGRRPEEVYDIVGLRVVISPQSSYDGLESMERGRIACYRVLEIVRSLWEEVPGRLKDYVANPKSNGYESLHVAVYLANSSSKQPTMELQVRTSMMDFKANDGEASHSLYKGGLTNPEQVQQVKKLMMAAADRAVLSLKELTRDASISSAPASEDQVFLLLDKNKDGEISMWELQQVMGDLGVDGSEAHELMQLVDTNKDGFVSADEFAEFKRQVSVLQGFDKRFSNKLGYTLRDSNAGSAREANQDACSNMASSLSSKPSPSRSEVEALRMVRTENVSSSEVNISSSPSAVVLKKPVTISSPTSEEAISDIADSLGTIGDRNEDTPAGMMRKDTSSLDLPTGLKALRRLIFRKHYELAKDLAKELYEHYPGDTDVLLEYAFVERQRGDLVAAVVLYSQAISAFKHQQNLGYDYVRALQALGSIEAHARNARKARVFFMESIRAARQAERLSPEMVSGASVYGLHAWARLEEDLGNWSKARDLLARAAEIQPGNAVIHQSRALLEAKAHNWGAARYHFSLAVEAAPNDIKCWHAWAIFEGRQRKQQKMRHLFQRALEVDPNSVHCLQAWAHQETLIGTPESKEKARSLFQRCTRIEPKSLYSWQAWAVMENVSGNYDKARELFEKCLEINFSSVPCLQAFATMERNLENWSAAQRLLRKALKAEPDNAAVLMEAAIVEKGLGNMEAAEKLFVLAGMADKKKSRVRNNMFASRKEVMPHKAGYKLWRAFGNKDPKTGSNFETIIDAIKVKELKSGTNVDTDKQPSSHFKHKQPSSHYKQGERHRGQVWVPTKSGA